MKPEVGESLNFLTLIDNFQHIFKLLIINQANMKRILSSVLTGIILLFVAGCATVYTAPEIQQPDNNKTIAILPFDVQVQYNKLPKNVTIEQVHENERELSLIMQGQIYNRFLQKKHLFPVAFQDVDQTNMLLRRNNIDLEKLGEFSKDELARLLEVDEIITGVVYTTKPMSTGAAVALGVLFGVWGPTNQAEVTVSLHSGIDSQLLWKFNHVYSGSVGSSPDQLSKAMMKPISRKFPYKQRS